MKENCLLYTSPSPRDATLSRMPSSAWKKKELKELEKFAKENGYNDELKDIYLREVIDRNKKYEWDLIFDQTSD